MISNVIACAVTPTVVVGIVAWRYYSPTQSRKRLIREARQMVASLRDIRPTWRAEDHPAVYRVERYDQMECLACMGSGEERFKVACRLCDGRGYLDAHHRDLTLAERRR